MRFLHAIEIFLKYRLCHISCIIMIMVICTDALLEQEYWETLYIRNMLLAIGKSSMFFFKVGKANGLTMLLDAETFDYMYQVK